MKNIFKDFSMKLYLKTVLYSLVIVVFIGTIFLFIEGIGVYSTSEVLLNSIDNPEIVREIGKDIEESYKELDEKIEEKKEEYGEDYPIRGYYQFILSTSAQGYGAVQLAKFSIPIGVILGTFVYIISVQKARGKNLIIESIVFVIIVGILLRLVNIGYQLFVNNLVRNITNSKETMFETGVYDLRENYIIFLIGYFIIFLVVYILNFMIQTIKVKKLNKELNKNK